MLEQGVGGIRGADVLIVHCVCARTVVGSRGLVGCEALGSSDGSRWSVSKILVVSTVVSNRANSVCGVWGIDVGGDQGLLRPATVADHWCLSHQPPLSVPCYPLQEGYVHLAQHGKLTLDSKKLKGELEDFLKRENRFNALTRKNPESSAKLHHHLQDDIAARQAKLQAMADESKPKKADAPQKGE